MRYAFIVNPISGRGGHEKGIAVDIEKLIAEHFDEDIGLYYTKHAKDAISIADTVAAEAMKAGEDIIVFACGGDGTVHEVANGIYGYDNAVLGVVPIGSGNDLVRELAGEGRDYKDYLNLELQMQGHVREIDVMEITGEENGTELSDICVNGVNIGFDGNTAVRANSLKERPLISGSFAYIMAVLGTLIKKDGQNLRITADGEVFHEGELLLVTASNGGYCGGGIRSCPRALVDDGEMELMAINDMTRLSFLSKFPKYKSGRVFDIREFDKIAKYRRAREIIIEPLASDRMKFVADGEVLDTGRVRIKVQPKAMTVWEI